MSASCAAEIMHLLETNTGTSSVSESCGITEQYFDLMGLLIWVAGIVILLSLKESHSAAQSNFAPNVFIMGTIRGGWPRFWERGEMEAKYPRLKPEKIMTAYLGYDVNVSNKKKQKKTNDYWRVSIGLTLIPKGN